MRIRAPRSRVWNAFLDPAIVPRFIPVKSVVSKWTTGSTIVWRTDLAHGLADEMTGVVVRAEAERALEYTYVNPITSSSVAVAIELADDADATLVSVVERGHRTEVERAHGEGGWRLALANLKSILEGG